MHSRARKRDCSGRRRHKPEVAVRADAHYDHNESSRYSSLPSTELSQQELTKCALELLEGKSAHARCLDLGSGSGFSTFELASAGLRNWVGIDISIDMLRQAQSRNKGDFCQVDISQGLCFRPRSFDLCVSISVLQWLSPLQLPFFFIGLRRCLTQTAHAVFQVYPTGPLHAEQMTNAAVGAGFTAQLLVEFPHAAPRCKQKKYFLILNGASGKQERYLTSKASLLQTYHSLGRAETKNSLSETSASNMQMLPLSECSTLGKKHCPVAWPMPAVCAIGLAMAAPTTCAQAAVVLRAGSDSLVRLRDAHKQHSARMDTLAQRVAVLRDRLAELRVGVACHNTAGYSKRRKTEALSEVEGKEARIGSFRGAEINDKVPLRGNEDSAFNLRRARIEHWYPFLCACLLLLLLFL
jgi:SAM-dependent methyltransferase